jgi:hypothetical protein
MRLFGVVDASPDSLLAACALVTTTLSVSSLNDGQLAG